MAVATGGGAMIDVAWLAGEWLEIDVAADGPHYVWKLRGLVTGRVIVRGYSRTRHSAEADAMAEARRVASDRETARRRLRERRSA